MADALISVLLEPLVSITTEFLTQEVKRVKGVTEDVSSLKSKLVTIKAVLEDAEKKQLESARVRRWLDQLRDVSYDIDNVLDEWNTEILKSKIQKQNAPVSTKKVCFPLPSSCFCQSQLKKVGILHKLALEIKKLDETLERIDKERRDYSLDQTTKVASNKRRETTSFVDVSEIYGRDVDKGHLISKLLCDSSSQGGKGPVIIPIVGMGGIGKTTLAQLAFNDDNVKANFNERVWVCVSEPFDEIGVAKAILQGLQVSLQDLNTLQALFEKIDKSIAGKKFLLVLDDVWTEDYEKWEQFIQPFRSGAAGSRLLVTTRKIEVAITMGVATQIISLELLSEEHCWLIFSRLAFSERSSEDCKILEETGRKIASKCKGLPLVAKTLGALMRSKESKRDWEDILSDEIWKSQDDKIKHFAPFLLSYYDLPPVEKRCFSYCSVFPKDYVFDRDELIEMWISQGYFSSDENPENEGRNCFKNLTMQFFFQVYVKDDDGRFLAFNMIDFFGCGTLSLFQDFKKDGDGSIVECKMHDILHDLAQFLTKNECFTMKVDEGNTQPPTVEKVRHLTLLLPSEKAEFGTSMSDQCNLRTLIYILNPDILGKLQSRFSSESSSQKELTLLSQLSSPLRRYLRTLNMRDCRISRLPGQLIGQMRHLRYLDLSENTHLQELPDEVCDLCNLQTLRLMHCSSLKRLPEGMGKLVNLRHLHIYGCRELKGLPKGIGRLTQLRTLDVLVIPEMKNDEEFLSIGDLEKMNHLQFGKTTEIRGCGSLESGSDQVEKLAGLMKRGNQAQYLHLRFHGKGKVDISKKDDEFVILEALQPHPSLKSLCIHYYLGANLCPNWMTWLRNLRFLHIFGCYLFEAFPPLGSLPSLEDLAIEENIELRKIGGEAGGITTTTSSSDGDDDIGVDDSNVAKEGIHKFISFPKLRRLKFLEMSGWEEWEGCESTINMPCLESLFIFDCDNLKSLPQFLKETPLEQLGIIGCEILSESFRRSGKEWAHISHVPNIKLDSKVVKGHGIWKNFLDGAENEVCLDHAIE